MLWCTWGTPVTGAGGPDYSRPSHPPLFSVLSRTSSIRATSKFRVWRHSSARLNTHAQKNQCRMHVWPHNYTNYSTRDMQQQLQCSCNWNWRRPEMERSKVSPRPSPWTTLYVLSVLLVLATDHNIGK